MAIKIECAKCKNDKCFSKQYCSGEYLEKISTSKNQNLYKKGDTLFREGAPMFGIYFVQNGGVKIVSSHLNGRQQIVRLATDGNILGHRALGKDKYYFNAIAMKDTLVCFMETDMFRDICIRNPDFSYNLLLFYALELRRTELRVRNQAQMSIREKVAMAFVYFNEVFEINPKTKKLNVELNRQDIAEAAGTTTEQVTRQLSDFESENLISRKKREIHLLNIKGLEYIIRDYKIE